PRGARGRAPRRLHLRRPRRRCRRHGVYTYGAGGVPNAAQELFAPVAYDAPAPLAVTAATTTVEPGGAVTLHVDGLVDGDAVKGVTLAGKAATYTRDGSTLVLSVPADAALGAAPVVVTSELGVTGSVTLTVAEPEPGTDEIGRASCR